MSPRMKLMGRMIVIQTRVMMNTNTSRCLWNLTYWMASMPHFLRIMSSESVNTLVIHEHIPRSTLVTVSVIQIQG